MAPLISPHELKRTFPAPPTTVEARLTAQQLLDGIDKRLAVLVGPCSIHDFPSAIEYAKRLKALSEEVSETLFIVMRVFIEKPRSKTGWKGILYDPHLNATHDIGSGLLMARRLFCEIAALGLPIATELLDPIVSFYFDDLIAWGMIGARTSASQPHRQMASRLPFPIGFKNDFLGALEPAVFGALSARTPHSHIGLDPSGKVSAILSKGNPFTHIVLRGSEQGSNYDQNSIATALRLLEEHGLPQQLLIDCSHGNSNKNLEKQKEVFFSVINQAASDPHRSIAGVMLESHLFAGRQSLFDPPSSLAYGVSITDPCLSWEETEELIRWADEKLSLAQLKGVESGPC